MAAIRACGKGASSLKVMTRAADAFIQWFLTRVLPRGFHRIRHYGLFASAARAATIARIRGLHSAMPPSGSDRQGAEASPPPPPCHCRSGRMIVIEMLGRVVVSRPGPGSSFKVDTS